jgi:uncharacterized membrane protein YbhN (UPF0104 family)
MDETMSDELSGGKLITFADDHLDRVLDRLEKSFQPVWEGQIEMGKTLITLASGTLVASVALIQLLVGSHSNLAWGWLMPLAWILFGVTVLTGAARQSWTSDARSFRLRLEYSRGSIREQLWGLDVSDPEFPTKFDSILAGALEKAFDQPKKAIAVHDVLNQLMFWSFAFGLAAVIVFAIRNVPL